MTAPSPLAQAIDGMVQRRQLLIIPNLLSREACHDVIMRALPSPVTPAEEDTFYAAPPTSPQRQATRMDVDDTLRHEVIAHFAACRPQLEAHFAMPLTRNERPHFLHYLPGDFFRPHADWVQAPIYEERRVSLILFLNDHQPGPSPAFEGGRLSFFVPHPHEPGKMQGIPIRPQAGLLLAFRSDLVHEVGQITAGERFSVVTWLAT
jgi:predicted 2-oxoglutarate/Fe(II)-dependent dioxygenase YbiX